MTEKTKNVFDLIALHQKSKEELIKMVSDLQSKDQNWLDKYSKLRKSCKEKETKLMQEIETYKTQEESYMQQYVVSEAEKEKYMKIADLKLGNAFKINDTWINKIVFILKEADRPLRSSEIIEIMMNNDITFRTLTDKQKALSTHLTKALKYGRIKGEKLKGQNGYLFSLP